MSCEAFDGHKEVQSALSDIALKRAEHLKFKYLVEQLMARDSVHYQVSVYHKLV